MIVFNGSEAGETTADALQRLPSALQYGADLVIVELGGNDMLNETDPQTVFGNLDQILRLCKVEGARVILAGMLSLRGGSLNLMRHQSAETQISAYRRARRRDSGRPHVVIT